MDRTGDRKKTERYCSTGQNPQRAAAPTEEEEELMKELKILRTELNTINCLCSINSSTLDVGIIASVYSLPVSPS
jgi:hypothetical protein